MDPAGHRVDPRLGHDLREILISTQAEDRQKIVACLIKRKCDLNKVDYHDHSALHYACVWGWVPTVDLLLEEGADPECSNIGALAASCHRRDSSPSHNETRRRPKCTHALRGLSPCAPH